MKISKISLIIAIVTLHNSLLGWQPDFLIIGAQKCGSTSLYNYVTKHPDILPAKAKELHFFNNYRGKNNFNKGISWYKKQFPAKQKNKLIGEATPEYLFFPHVPERVYSLFPSIKIIIILRNPTKRAISYFHHNKKRKMEPLDLEQALTAETERLQDEQEKIAQDPNYYSYNVERYSYKKRGLYLEQIQRWLEYFPKEQILILKSEELFANPSKTLEKVYTFLNVENIPLKEYPQYNQSTYTAPIDPIIIKQLNDYFAPYNQQLSLFLKEEFDLTIEW